MANSNQRQRKLAAKVAHRKAAVAEKKRMGLPAISLLARVTAASKGSIVYCVMSSTLFDVGIGHAVIARRLPSGLLGCAWFMVDVWCLGIKDVCYHEINERELQANLADQNDMQKFKSTEPSCARKLIRDAAAYAADLGLATAKETPVIESIFGDIDANACQETFIFGKDGKPFYLSGPRDTPARIRLITRMLQDRCGTDGWSYIIEAQQGLLGTDIGFGPNDDAE
jgi:hypothetical protein